MGFRSDSQRKGFYANQSVNMDAPLNQYSGAGSGKYDQDQHPLKQHLLKRFVGHAIKNKHSAEDRQFLKETKQNEEKAERIAYARAKDKQKEIAQLEKLKLKQLEKGEISYHDLEQFKESKAGLLPAEFQEKQAEKHKEQLNHMIQQNSKQGKEISSHIEDNADNIIVIQKKIEEAQREIGKLDLSPPRADDPIQFIKHQHDLVESKNRELALNKEIEKLKQTQDQLKENNTKLKEKLGEVNKNGQELQFASKSETDIYSGAFGMAKGNPNAEVHSKERQQEIDNATKERERYIQKTTNPTPITPDGSQHKRYNPQTHQYDNTLPSHFVGFDENHNPIFKTNPPKQAPSPDMTAQQIKESEADHKWMDANPLPEDEDNNPRISVRLSRQ